MKDEEIRFMESLCTSSHLSLRSFCNTLSKGLDLPDFEYDAENETEWGWVQTRNENIEVNISIPYAQGKLQEWDESIPENCNLGILLIVSDNAPPAWNLAWSLEELVPEFAQRVANMMGKNVYHHRTWVAPGQNILRDKVYSPVNSEP